MRRREFLRALPAVVVAPLIPLPKTKGERALYYEDTDWIEPEYNSNLIESWRIIWACKPECKSFHFNLWADSVNPQFKFESITNRPGLNPNVPDWITRNIIKGNRDVIARVTKYWCGLTWHSLPYSREGYLHYDNMLNAMDRWLAARF